jgi:hypothetical protein
MNQKIKEVTGSLDRDTVVRACKRFQWRIEAMVEADDDFIKKTILNAFFFNIFLLR